TDLTLWDAGSGRRLRMDDRYGRRYCQSVSVAPDGTLAATYNGEGIAIWPPAWKVPRDVPAPEPVAVAFSPRPRDGRLVLADSTGGGSIQLRDGRSGVLQRSWRAADRQVNVL